MGKGQIHSLCTMGINRWKRLNPLTEREMKKEGKGSMQKNKLG